MEFQSVLEKRRSVRKYNDKEVEDTDIEKIIQAGMLAPSAHHRQPWKVMILKSDQKNEIVKFMKEYAENSKTTDKTILRTAEIMENANTLLLIFNTSQEDYLMDTLSIGAMIENMCLKATDLGISSLWIGNHLKVKLEIEQYFKIPEDMQLVSALALGYFDGVIPPLKRKEYKEVLYKL